MRGTHPAVAAVLTLALFPAAASAYNPDLPADAPGCRTKTCDARVRARAAQEVRDSCRADSSVADRRGACTRERWREVIEPHAGWLARVRACESTNNYAAIDPSGTYTGAYQFDDGTWQSVGGEGRAMNAEPLEQDYRAVRLMRGRGSSPWPVCG